MGYFKLLRVRRTPSLRPPSHPPPAMMARVYLTIVSDDSNCRRRAAIRQRSPLPFTRGFDEVGPPSIHAMLTRVPGAFIRRTALAAAHVIFAEECSSYAS